ncbi:MAG: hypothetical protein WDM81_12760 [Rhizomicrobium sp.]
MDWASALRVGVGHEEFDAFQMRRDHVVDRVAAGGRRRRAR